MGNPILWFFLLLLGVAGRKEESLQIAQALVIITIIGITVGLVWYLVVAFIGA